MGNPLTTRRFFAYATVFIVWGGSFLAIREIVAVAPPFLSASFRFLVAGLAAGGLVAIVIIARYFRRFRMSESLSALLIHIAVTIFLRMTLFAFLDATWWMFDYERYIFPVMPLTSCFLILLIYQAFATWRSRVV